MNGGRPPILTTTSRKPARRTRSFHRDLVKSFVNLVRFTRGKYSVRDIVGLCQFRHYNRVIFIDEIRANPSRMRFYYVEGDDLKPAFILLLSGVRLIREFRNGKDVRARFIVPFSGTLTENQIVDALAEFFGLRKLPPSESLKDKGAGIVVRERSDGIVALTWVEAGKPTGFEIRVRKFVK